ncbi:MAG: hypothetical protein D6699_04295 [Aquificota bacterium]|nr:MAG: hypothetical protein D6699_04295 [Aquificota bacterium]
MDRVYSIEERVILIVREFVHDLKGKEPFPSHLSDYSFRLRAKLVELVNQFPSDANARNFAFDSALEGILKSLESAINGANLEDKKEIERLIQTLEKTNEVLKNFLYSDQIRDKQTLSKVSGKIGEWIEGLRMELNRRFGGLWNRIKSLFGK